MNIVILGAAESGVGAALLAQAKGHTVFVSDRGPIQADYRQQLTAAGIAFEENQHSLDKILAADEVVKSPGIPEKSPVVQALREKNVPIISEIELPAATPAPSASASPAPTAKPPPRCLPTICCTRPV